MSHLKVILAFLLCNIELSTERKLIYEKDVSEHCRRRVIPSVFLGKQVMEANSEILHFSAIDMPYNCFVSVRTESGSNIILVIELHSRENLLRACHESGSQLVVYEFGDTFGGYWGPLPEKVLASNQPDSSNNYTLKTTQMESTTEFSLVKEVLKKANITKVTKAEDDTQVQNDKDDYMSIELPIVNVSAKLVPGKIPFNPIFDVDDSFDLFYDVTPGKKIKYDTSVIPLLQFSMDGSLNSNIGRGGGVEYSPFIGEDSTEGIALEPRLIYSDFDFLTTTKHTRSHGYKYDVNKLLSFKKDKHLQARKKYPPTSPRTQLSPRPLGTIAQLFEFIQQPTLKEESSTNSWELINDLLKRLNKSSLSLESTKSGDTLNSPKTKRPDITLGFRGYLTNASMQNIGATSTRPPSTARATIGSITWRLPSIIYGSSSTEELSVTQNNSFRRLDEIITNEDTKQTIVTNFYLGNSTFTKINEAVNKDENDISANKTESYYVEELPTKNLTMQTGSLVGHESWDNVVQSAPVMAVILNQTIIPKDNDTKEGLNHTEEAAAVSNSSVERKKRSIYGIPIGDARPRHRPTEKQRSRVLKHSFTIDVQELAELIELQDDEIYGRLALRYMRQYVGPSLFNICDHNDTFRTIHLFNSSRIVLAINNFTMKGMTIIMTPAQTVFGDARCKGANLECQVGGARVCIDSMNACNGIPNCGSYDVYDEDRLMCGTTAGLRQNVCLAAFTFLAVLLTVLYIVHYWLKRCVPKVSDAFFIYSDTAENILYLDSLMRAPYDDDDSGRSNYRTRIFQEDSELLQPEKSKRSCNFFAIIKNKVLICCCKRKKSLEMRADILGEMNRLDTDKFNFFTEIELGKMVHKKYSNVAVQTGSSLEMAVRPETSTHIADNERELSSDTTLEYPYKIKLELEPQKNDELSIINFFRNSRSAIDSKKSDDTSVPQNKDKTPVIVEEKELEFIDFERDLLMSPLPEVPTTSDIQLGQGQVRKKLRFDDVAHTISEDIDRNDLTDLIEGDIKPAEGSSKRDHSQDISTNDESEGGSREYRSYFWGGAKRKTNKVLAKKKSKKNKSRLSLS